MTAPDWAVEKAARTLWIGEQESDKDRAAAARYWDDASIPDDVIERDHYRRQARAALDDVWPETTTEWGVMHPDYEAPRHTRRGRDHVTGEAAALNSIFETDAYRVVSRTVTEWREVQP